MRDPSRPTPSEILDAAQAELNAINSVSTTKDLGVAEPVPGQARHYCVSKPRTDLSGQPAGELFLIGPQSRRVDVDELLIASHDEIVVSAAVEPQDGPFHLHRKFDASFISKAFIEYLSKSPQSDISSHFVESRLTAGQPVDHAGFNVLQREAIGFALQGGLSVVWGPPGTGKTRVIGAAVTQLAANGNTVAIVSNTNIAVDQALLSAALAAEPFEPGRFVRVGHASSPEILNHPTLTARKAAEAVSKDLSDRDSELDAMIEENNAAAPRRLLADLQDQLGGHDAEALEAFCSIRSQLERRPDLLEQMGEARRVFDEAESAANDSNGPYVQACEERKRLEQFADLPQVDQEARTIRAATAIERKRLAGLQADRQQAQNGRWRGRKKRVQELDDSIAATTSLLERLQKSLRPLDERVEDCRSKGVSPNTVTASEAREGDAQVRWRSATLELVAASGTLAEIKESLSHIDALPAMDVNAQLALYLCDAYGSASALLDEVESLQITVNRLDDERQAYLLEIERIAEELREVETTVVSNARVVGTTIAQLVLHKGLIDRSFDFVIIDEASAAMPMHAYTALTKALKGASLIGDFEQNGPISNTLPGRTPPRVSRWLHMNPFQIVGIKDLESAQKTAGCVALRDQYRFGTLTTLIANEMSYGGLLRNAKWEPPRAIGDPEIILVDTSTLGEAGRYEKGPKGKGRWWPAGALISREIANCHRFENIGVVTPYRLQAQLANAHLRDTGGAAVQVGTAHAFQGREFETVILDLVENGDGTSWVSQAKRGGTQWALDGVRLFNVAVTRNAHRLYIVGSIPTIRTAQVGPLAVLGQLLKRDLVSVIDAGELLRNGLTASAISAVAPPERTSSASPMMFDSVGFYQQLARDFAEARHRVVIISPFIGWQRMNDLRQALRDLVRRGVAVTCVVNPPVSEQAIALCDGLSSLGVVVRQIVGFHEKVLIVDDELTYAGSLNVLSNTPHTSELMMRFEGHESTRLIETWMRSALKRSARP